MLIVLGGLPGTGKTAIARELAQRLGGAVHLRVDTIEQAIVRSGAARHPVGSAGYEVGYALAADFLRQGLTVIADSVNPLPVTRAAWRDSGRATAAPVVEIEIICSDPEEHERRASTRTSDIPDLPLPDWSAINARDYRPWDEPHLVCDTAGRTVGDCANEIQAMLPRRAAGR